jgi:hypothetical protein
MLALDAILRNGYCFYWFVKGIHHPSTLVQVSDILCFINQKIISGVIDIEVSIR